MLNFVRDVDGVCFRCFHALVLFFDRAIMTERTLSFFIPGVPAPGGSKKAFIPKGWSRAVVTDAGGKKNKDWRAVVALTAFEAMKNGGEGLQPLFEGPLSVSMTFIMPRPKSHFNKKGLKPDAPVYHAQYRRNDLLKLARSTEDAMTGVVYHDDGQIAIEGLRKIYGDKIHGETTGAHIEVRGLKEPGQ